jgi:nucleoside-diphosphate kinase
MEQTLILVKPDAMQRGMAGEILARLERRGLRIAAMRMLRVDEDLASRHYAEHTQKPFYRTLVDFITSTPIVAAVMEGPNAVEVVRATMGATDPAKASPGTIRGDFGMYITQNLIHGSDSTDSAAREIALFFDKGDIYSYPRDIDRWLFDAPD